MRHVHTPTTPGLLLALGIARLGLWRGLREDGDAVRVGRGGEVVRMGVEGFEERDDGGINAALRGLVQRQLGECDERRYLPVSEVHGVVVSKSVFGFGLGFLQG